MAAKLAMFGGSPTIPADQRHVVWPVVTQTEQAAMQRVLASGKFTISAKDEQEVSGLEHEWASFTETRYAVGVSNGTCSLGLALAALGVQPGDEVLVPALSYIASALAPLYQLAIPVFVDVDPFTFNIDLQHLAAKITPRTRAIIPVHMHGLPADMDEINALAMQHGLVVVEDAAQAQGARYRDRMVGSLGAIGSFSLNVEKNIPTCGEGGLLTMDDPELYHKCRMMRLLGEDIDSQPQRTYISHMLGWNYKLSSVQAAFTRCQLQRYPQDQAQREANVGHLLARLAELPGIVVPTTPDDRTHVWHIVRLRFDPAAAGLEGISPGQFRHALQRALVAEGVPLAHYQMTPLCGHPVFQLQEGYGGGYPWTMPGALPQRYEIEDYPNTLAIIEDSLVLRRAHLNPGSGPLLELYADAFVKVWEDLERIGRIARSMPYQPPWEKIARRDQAATV